MTESNKTFQVGIPADFTKHATAMKTVRKHMTLRNLERDRIIEKGIDATIDRALDRWLAMPLVVSVCLVSAVPVFRSDGEIFITMLADVELENP